MEHNSSDMVYSTHWQQARLINIGLSISRSDCSGAQSNIYGAAVLWSDGVALPTLVS
jgi:outer membrane usher protein FimD/PapC